MASIRRSLPILIIIFLVAFFLSLASLKSATGKIFQLIGNRCLDKYDRDRAIWYYKQAIKLEPLLDEAHYFMCQIYSEQGLEDLAKRELETAIRIRPDESLYWHELGAHYIEKKEYRKATKFLERAIKLAPYFPEHYLLAAEAHDKLGNNTLALNLYNSYLRLNSHCHDMEKERQVRSRIEKIKYGLNHK